MNINATTQWTPAHGKLLLAVALDPPEIGRRIADARARKGWTQLTFALEAHVSPSTVARWEAGKLPPVRELMRIADVLEVDADVLVEPAEKTPSEASRQELEALREELSEVRDMVAQLLNQQQPPRRAARRSA